MYTSTEIAADMKQAMLTMMTVCAMAQVSAQTTAVGFLNLRVPAQSDASVSLSLNRPAVYQGAVASIAGSQVTLSGAPALPAGGTYAVVLTSGAKNGLAARITAHAGAVVTLALEHGDDLAGVAAGTDGDQVKITPVWTPASLLPATIPVGTQILTYSGASAGVNLAPNVIYVHTGDGEWENGVSGADSSDAPLPVGAGLVLRNPSASAIQTSIVGEVPGSGHRITLSTLAGNQPQDIRFGYVSPVPESLGTAGLGGASEGDQIFSFNNLATGFNKAPSQLIIVDGGVWKDQITGNSVGATFHFTPGAGYVYRKAATPAPSSTVWSDVPAYLAPNP